MSVSFNKNGIVSGDNFYDYNKHNIAYHNNTPADGIALGYTPTTAVNSYMGGYRIRYDDILNCRKYKIIIDVEWSGFDTSNTNGTFGMWWQGSVWDRETSSWVWTIHNSCCAALNNTYYPTNLVLSAESGTYRYETVFTISKSDLQKASMAHIGFRSDYSNGTGWIKITNIKVVPFLENTYEMKIKTLDDGSEWARIHWLDVSETVEWFASEDEVAYCVDKSNRYSRMGNVDEFKTASGVYEFMLTYPSLSDTLYNRWTQTSSPNESTVTGFTEVTTAWSQRNAGIKLSTVPTNTVYDCDPVSGNWFAPVGALTRWDSTQLIPAANQTSQTSTELWVRIDTLPKKMKVFKNLITANDFIEL